jgi:hypothetical protein
MAEEKLIILADENNWTLIARRVVTKKGSKNPGSTYDHTIGYFSNLHDMAVYASERQLRVHGIEEYETAKNGILEALEKAISTINDHECKCGHDLKKCVSSVENLDIRKRKRGRRVVVKAGA